MTSIETNKPYTLNMIADPTSEEGDLITWLGRLAHNVRYVGSDGTWRVEFTYNRITTSMTGTSMGEVALQALNYISANSPPLEPMQVYHLSQNTNQSKYAYFGCIVVAPNHRAAQITHPMANHVLWNGKEWVFTQKGGKWVDHSWANPNQVLVTHIGTAAPNIPPQVICTFQ